MTDRLGVLSSTRFVVDRSKHVHFDLDRLQSVAQSVAQSGIVVPAWNNDLHWAGEPEQTALYILLLDSLNFCFWGEPRWKVTYGGNLLDGYWALAASLRRAVEQRSPVLDASYLAVMPEGDLRQILRGTTDIPLFAERLANVHELGRVLRDGYQGSAARFIGKAGGDAVQMALQVAAELHSFADVALYDGQPVRILKRAQILVGDLAGSLNHQGLGAFERLEELTAFADYKLPQILRRFGILVYEPDLASQVDRQQLIPAGSAEEVEIRAHTVWAVELMRQSLAGLGRPYAPYQLDWWLWEASQHMTGEVKPYHRTRTIFY